MNVDPKTGRRALGRGLDALLPAAPAAAAPSYGERSVFLCPVERIVPQQGQPRQHFDAAELDELARSISEHGLIEPLVVRRMPGHAQSGAPPSSADRFELIAGERRWRASQRAGLKDVLVVVKDVSSRQAFELALVENVQRSDLNAIEVAEAFHRLQDEFGYTQEQIAERVGKDRTTVTNALRLLKLPERIRSMVITRDLSEGHARALLAAPTDKVMNEIAERVVRGRLPVRKVEALVRAAKNRAHRRAEETGSSGKDGKSAGVKDLEARLGRQLGTRVTVRDDQGSGELAIAYGSLDELDRILAALGFA
jgi:ParB family chromosome partitioning protein